VTSCRCATRYLPRARYRYPYRLRSRGGNAGKIAGAAAGVLLAAAFSTHAAAHRHTAGHAPARTVTVTAAAPVTSGSETAFIGAVLADLGAPDTAADVTSLADWFPHEWPQWPPEAANDPLDSILPAPGSTDFNTFDGNLHVQNYPTAAEGAQATAQTLANGYYPQILAALKSGAGLCGNPNLAAEFDTWSGGGYSGVC
jgi:hypothetical protein